MTDVEIAQNDEPIEETQPREAKWGKTAAWILVFGLLLVLGLSLVRSQEGPVQVGTQAPEYILTTFEGDQIDSQDLHGKIVVINFWASWCKPCEQEAVELEQAYQALTDDGVVFLGVNYVDTEKEALDYLDRFGVTYPNGPDLGTRISQSYRIRGVPETFIVSPTGVVTYFKKGPFTSVGEIMAAVQDASPE